MSKYQDLSVPFSVPIPGGVSPGTLIVVQGKVPSMSHRFAVNLLTRSGDIALHVCPRFKENRVVRNNVLNMNWGPEESHGSMPIHPGQSFEIFILCESYSFKVAFNGTHFCEFSHRLPFNTITSLAVDGDVVVHNVNFKDSSGYGSNNNVISNSAPYGFRSDPAVNHNSGGLYPSVDSYPYPSVPPGRRSPSPGVPNYPGSGGSRHPSGPGYPGSGGGGYPQNPSLYPTQPAYPSVPHQGPYPQVPNSHSGGVSPTPHTKPGFLDQAGAALAGVLGPAVLAGGMNRHAGQGRPNLLDEAGRALAGVIGGSDATGQGRRGTHPQSPTHQSGFLDNAGSTLAGILGGAGLMGATGRSLGGMSPGGTARQTHPGSILDSAGSALAGILASGGLAGDRSMGGRTGPTRQGQPGTILDQAGSALAGILAGGGMAGANRSIRGATPPGPTNRQTHPGSILDQAGSALAGILGGGGLSGVDRSMGGRTPSGPARQTHPGSVLDQPASALASLFGGGGLTDSGHHNRKKLGILGGTLGTAVAGAALTGHLNPIKATKKQLKAQKKALKYGLPLAGAGLGAYALHKGLKKGFRRSSSSSSSSSCCSSD